MSTASHPNSPRPPRPRTLRLLVWLLLLATIGPCAYIQAPREVGRWYLAGAKVERDAGRKELADRHLTQAQRWMPDDPQLLLQETQWHLEDGNLEAALAACNRLVELQPDDFQSLFTRSQVLDRMGKEAEARADWKTIDRFSQTRGLSREDLQRAILAVLADREAGRKAEAYERLGLVIGWSPAESDLVLERARWRVLDGQYAEALDDCDRALKLEPENANSLLLRSQVYQHLGRHPEAIADMKFLDRLSRAKKQIDRTLVLNGLAYARALGGVELTEGLKDANEALHAAPKDAAILDTRGYVLYKQGEHEAALPDMNAAVEGIERDFKRQFGAASGSSPRRDEAAKSVAVIRYHRALVLEKLGRYAEAKLDRARAKQLIGREPDDTLF